MKSTCVKKAPISEKYVYGWAVLVVAMMMTAGDAWGQQDVVLEIELFQQLPRLLVRGEVGSAHTIQYNNELGNSNGWQVLTNLTLPSASVMVVDFSAVNLPRRFYRTVANLTGLVNIPAGKFMMGSPNTEAQRHFTEGPQTEVTISRGFWMGKYEVTQAEYSAVMGNNPSYFTNGATALGSGGGITNQLNHPVEQVSWFDATNYCVRLTERERLAGRLPQGHVYRLPTEAEWEYACRAGTTTAFHYGPALRSGMANFDASVEYDSSGGSVENPNGIWLGQTTPVGSYAPNAWGLYDMHGNVWEWCQDWWAQNLPGGSVIDPTGPNSGSGHVFRGGCWSSYAWYERSAFRLYDGRAESCDIGLGFRIVLAPVQP